MTNTRSICISRLALAGLLRLLEHLLDDLLLLDQESTDDTVLDATGAARTTVGTADVLLGARDLGVFTGAESGDLESDDIHHQHSVFPTGHIFQETWWLQSFSSTRFPFRTVRFSTPRHSPAHTHTPHRDTQDTQHALGENHSGVLTPGSLMPQSPHLGAVPFFLMWRYRSSPPGVLTIRTLLDRVLYL